ncbi:XF1762 family protein [Actinophytocola sp.]|uniref:XF1762 family protein n=1 Tax=Actinophytocola sp. TaxID=1872138 RepID=UPI003899E7D6
MSRRHAQRNQLRIVPVTVEVTRTCTLGDPGANSMLYGAAWRAARALGYHRMITYTHHDESVSPRAAGMIPVAELPARPGWTTPSRPRADRRTGGIARTGWEIRTHEFTVSALPQLLLDGGVEAA